MVDLTIDTSTPGSKHTVMLKLGGQAVMCAIVFERGPFLKWVGIVVVDRDYEPLCNPDPCTDLPDRADFAVCNASGQFEGPTPVCIASIKIKQITGEWQWSMGSFVLLSTWLTNSNE